MKNGAISLLIIGLIITLLFLLKTVGKKDKFLDNYHKFFLTHWNGDEFVHIRSDLSKKEKEKLKIIFDNDNVVYKDTLSSFYIYYKEFYADKDLFFSSYTDFILDSSMYNYKLQVFDSLSKLNSNQKP